MTEPTVDSQKTVLADNEAVSPRVTDASSPRRLAVERRFIGEKFGIQEAANATGNSNG
jgi:hypothetical protein